VLLVWPVQCNLDALYWKTSRFYLQIQGVVFSISAFGVPAFLASAA